MVQQQFGCFFSSTRHVSHPRLHQIRRQHLGGRSVSRSSNGINNVETKSAMTSGTITSASRYNISIVEYAVRTTKAFSVTVLLPMITCGAGGAVAPPSTPAV
jgi:hypothetical protein